MKAEDRALERFPVHEGASKEWIESHLKGVCSDYIEGYHQAEKDLALTLVDIRKICLIAREVHKYYGFWSDIVYQEVLNRFNKQKEK